MDILNEAEKILTIGSHCNKISISLLYNVISRYYTTYNVCNVINPAATFITLTSNSNLHQMLQTCDGFNSSHPMTGASVLGWVENFCNTAAEYHVVQLIKLDFLSNWGDLKTAQLECPCQGDPH